MTPFRELAAMERSYILIFLFLSVLCIIFQIFYEVNRPKKIKRLLLDIIELITCLAVMTGLAYVGTGELHTMLFDKLPWCVPVLLGFTVTSYSIIGMFLYHRQEENELTPLAVKQFIDDMPTGLCFSDALGRIVLCNREMIRIFFALTGNYPQMLDELTDALQNTTTTGATVMEGNEKYYRFPDGKIWRFQSYSFDDTLAGWTQTMAVDMTEIHDGNEKIKKDNEALRETNRKIQQMFDSMTDTIREKESLELKVYIHDVLGRSLLTIQDIMDNNREDMEKKITLLKEAVGVLSSNRPTFENTFDEVRQKAANIGVKVMLDGYIPSDTVMESLIVSATRECVTNCIRHAGGNEVTVRIRELVGISTVIITNNGTMPKGKIVEGSGLSSLRRSVEVSGGEMHIAIEPAFALILNLSRKEFDL